MQRSSAWGFKGEVAMSRPVLSGECSPWRCRDGKFEDVGHRCNDLINSTTAGEYAMKRADVIEPMLT